MILQGYQFVKVPNGYRKSCFYGILPFCTSFILENMGKATAAVPVVLGVSPSLTLMQNQVHKLKGQRFSFLSCNNIIALPTHSVGFVFPHESSLSRFSITLPSCVGFPNLSQLELLSREYCNSSTNRLTEHDQEGLVCICYNFRCRCISNVIGT